MGVITYFVTWSLCMLGLGLAAPAGHIRTRDLQSIQGAFVSVSVAASNLDIAVRSVTGDPASAQALAPALKGIENAMAQARVDATQSQPISIPDGQLLQQSADTFAKSVKIMVMSSMLQRTAFDQLGMTPMVLQSFKNQNVLSESFRQTVLSKLPAEGLSGSMSAFGGAAGSIGMAISTFSTAPFALPLSPGTPPPMAPAPAPNAPPAILPPAAPAPAVPAPAVPAPPTAPPQELPAPAATPGATAPATPAEPQPQTQSHPQTNPNVMTGRIRRVRKLGRE